MNLRKQVENAVFDQQSQRSDVLSKSINEIVRSFQDLIERLIVDAANGNLKRSSFTEQMRQAIIDDATLAYQEGMREGGSKDPEADYSSRDKKLVNGWIVTQASYINEFVDGAIAANKETGDARTKARNDMMDRAQLWVDNLNALGNLGTASRKGDMMVGWSVGSTEHCPTCLGLNGKTAKLSWFVSRGLIPQMRGNPNLKCKGYKCQCKLKDLSGNQIMP